MNIDPTTDCPVQPRQGTDPESIKVGVAEHLKYTLAEDHYTATTHDRFMALAYAVRDRLIKGWIETQQTHHTLKAKRVYYLSLEFLMGRALNNNIINLCMEKSVRQGMTELGVDLDALCEEEADAGLGNGGLGRLAACFLDSLATLQIPAIGYGLRYNYGIFRQEIENGYQVEHPDEWLRGGNPWEIARPDVRVPVHFGGKAEVWKESGSIHTRWIDTAPVFGIAYDTPIVGYGGNTVNTLRLWSAHASEDFDLEDFNKGDYIAAVENKVGAETLTKVLYPNDLHYLGKELRLKQQYFFVACSLYDIIRRFKKDSSDWNDFPNLVALQLNDTHPSLAVPELMRLLVDVEGLDWDQAWELTVKATGYTNHTLMPEALEKWPVDMFGRLLPRHLQIVYEINHHFLQKVSIRFPGDMERMSRLSLIEEGDQKQVRMANLAIIGSHSTNGVSAIHTDLLKSRVVPDFAAMFPERFNSKTNGITQRRWLLASNPRLAALITEAIGDKWITDLEQLRNLAPLADDSAFREKFRAVKHAAKETLSNLIKERMEWSVDPDAIFDVQVKRLHEYKRQLMNAIHVIMLYNRLRKNPRMEFTPQVFLFGAKAAPGYHMAKLIIKLISNLGNVINQDPAVNDKLRIYFLPNYSVSLAEKVFPASEVSEQISTAGTEASGTGNMKFMLNGALTIGTMDGANIEIAEEVGQENMFIFGLDAAQAKELSANYNPMDYYQGNAELREALDLVFSGHFSVSEPGIFEPIRQSLLEWGDRYLVLADMEAYAQAQERVQTAYRDPDSWWRKAILNVAYAGKFSSDRTIREYAKEIWQTPPCPIDQVNRISNTLVDAQGTLKAEIERREKEKSAES